nr:hypothetical protein [Tanacetum cinerariifolium]
DEGGGVASVVVVTTVWWVTSGGGVVVMEAAAAAVSAGLAVAAAMVGTPRGELVAVDLWCGGHGGGKKRESAGCEVVVAAG